MSKPKLFVSYSHNDSIYLKKMQEHLQPLTRNGLIDLWDDTRIEAGSQNFDSAQGVRQR